MAPPPETVVVDTDSARQRGRYVHAGDVIRLLGSGIALLVCVTAALFAGRHLLGDDAWFVHTLNPATSAGSLLTGLVQGAAIVAPVAITAVLLRRRRFRLLLTLTGVATVAALLCCALSMLADDAPEAMLAFRHVDSGLRGAGFPTAA